jgi:3-hydroxyisobutyrate dehydrogenase
MNPLASRIAFIGLGIMGGPMAGHLIRGGHSLLVHTRTKSKAEPLLADGARWCESPAAAAAQADYVMINVPDTPDVEAVLFGPAGVCEALRPGAAVIDFSTISPAATRDFAARLAERGAVMLDAPVTGGEAGAKNATLTILVGGERAAFEQVLPLLQHLGNKIVHVGPSGSGQAMKAINQVLVAVNMIGVCEALALARASGLDPAMVIDALGGGAGGSWALSNLGAKIVAGDLKPAFMIALMQKDLRIVQEAAQLAHVPLPGVALAQQLFRVVEAEAGGDRLGTQAMIIAYEQLTGRR